MDFRVRKNCERLQNTGCRDDAASRLTLVFMFFRAERPAHVVRISVIRSKSISVSRPGFSAMSSFRRTGSSFRTVPTTAAYEPPINLKHCMIAALSTLVYGFAYLINILINGKGVWPDSNDWYGFLNWGMGTGLIIFAGIVLASFGIACLLRGIKKKCSKRVSRL